MKNKGTDRLKKILKQEFRVQFEAQRTDLRQNAKAQILKIQQENRKVYNLQCSTSSYKIGDLVAIN